MDKKFPCPTTDETSYFWTSIFKAMSSEFFEEFKTDLQFSVENFDLLRKIAQDFIIAGRKLPENYTLRLSGTPEKLETIWQKTFNQLETIGAADKVYQWGQRQYKKKLQFRKKVEDNAWNPMLIQWAQELNHVYAVKPLPLLENQTLYIKYFVLRFFTKYQRISLTKIRMERMYQDDKFAGEWGYYLFRKRGIGAWFSGEIFLNTQLSMWKNIFDRLSDDELEIFNNWGKEDYERRQTTSYLVSLPELKDEFANAGYDLN